MFNLKKIINTISFIFLLIFVSLFTFACGNSKLNTYKASNATSSITKDTKNVADKKIAIAYFSITGNTEKVALKIAETLNIDAYKIEPQVPYEDSDFLEGNNNTRPLRESRLNLFEEERMWTSESYITSFGVEVEETKETEELQKATELPKIKNLDLKKYDIIFIGYPIWFQDAPKVIYTLVKDFKDKTIIPFCTSDNDNITASEERLSNFVDISVQVLSGKRFQTDVDANEIKKWFTDLSIDIK